MPVCDVSLKEEDTTYNPSHCWEILWDVTRIRIRRSKQIYTIPKWPNDRNPFSDHIQSIFLKLVICCLMVRFIPCQCNSINCGQFSSQLIDTSYQLYIVSWHLKIKNFVFTAILDTIRSNFVITAYTDRSSM